MAPHTHKKKLLKLYLLLNYNISDNHRVGQGKIKKKKKEKKKTSAGHFCPSRSVIFPHFFQRLPCAKWRKLQAAPRFCTLFLLCRERGPMILGAEQFISAWQVGSRRTPFTCWNQNLVGIAQSSLLAVGNWHAWWWPNVLHPSLARESLCVVSLAGFPQLARLGAFQKPSSLCRVQGLERR